MTSSNVSTTATDTTWEKAESCSRPVSASWCRWPGCLLADPQIFVMDEATSSIDTETETLIQEAIDRVMTGRLSFVIAHRLSTIRDADRILFIESGRILEDGTHEELMGRNGRYAELYAGQFTAG